MYTKKIGVMGLAFNSGNKGCEAISCVFLDMLFRCIRENGISISLYIFIQFRYRTFVKYFIDSKYRQRLVPNIKNDQISYKVVPLNDGIFSSLSRKAMDKCDVIIDFTSGDSFTDIYGEERFFSRSLFKKWAIMSSAKFILGSQTIGPFNSPKVKETAKKILKNSDMVFARDKTSYDCVKEISGIEPILSTDIAFNLPYEKELKNHNGKIKIGLNLSGLLWNGGYTKDNQFGLKVNYKEYCTNLIGYLYDDSRYEIYLIPHVFGQNSKGIYSVDDDVNLMVHLKQKYPKLNAIPIREYSASDLKSIISEMDVMVASRMHATVAAFSSGVATIPFSYSRKFEGLYNSIGYEYVVSGKELTTDEAVRYSLELIDNKELLIKKSQLCMSQYVFPRIEDFYRRFEKVLLS